MRCCYFIRAKKQCEKFKKQDKANTVPTPYFLFAFFGELGGRLKTSKMKKTFRLIGMALVAVLMCAACSNEEVVSDEPTQDKYITVGLGCVRENIDITDSPLSRAATTNDLYGIQIYTVEEGSTTPYAHGVFNTLDNVTVKLLSQKTYKFSISVVIDGYSRGFIFTGSHEENNTNQFFYDVNGSIITSYTDNCLIAFERFYGELDNYTPVENENVIVETKRVSYGAKYIAENLSEGCIDINVICNGYGSLYTVNLTTTNNENDNIYTFSNILGAYKNNDYSVKNKLTITWTKDNGEVVPLGTYTVAFKRNVKTTIRIKAGDLSVNKGITVTKEDTPFSDDENEYIIEGGEIITVPVNSSQS